MPIVITWSIVKWAGLPLFVLSFIGAFILVRDFIVDDDKFRFFFVPTYVSWFLFVCWLVVIVVHGLLS